jgi:hypothetical protein
MNQNLSTAAPQEIPTTGRIGRMTEHIRRRAGEAMVLEVIKDLQQFETTSNYPKKAGWIRETIGRLDELVGETTAREIMQECGRACFGSNNSTTVRKLMEKSSSLEDFIAQLNARHLGGGRLIVRDQNTICGGYDRCYCGQVKQTKQPFPNLTYCHCSTGWYRQLFESALEKPVRVEILQSIISGSNSCEFIIHLD